ncbi:transglutaminase-like cysteine peptidase [Noviherbaspirillum pedocola]|uniref:Transglutaminase-like cysteine peptidase n=1 Tax=Noviherbaspirillum pedocola TaxID=2801341 RepID=A0A934SYZ0_9BURK|nr:transglutaminase-like cysteine peptidase [Noviherbaspirillum pedocola]MBK4737601.1 transglutaminase-like cysteine peptidase [Noviherbaspirillum pedocola]
MTGKIAVTSKRPFLAAIFVGWLNTIHPAPLTLAFAHCTRMRLPVERITPRLTAYDEFCRSHPGDCDMTGSAVMNLNPGSLRLLDNVNRQVNAEIRLTDDFEWRGKEEEWNYPVRGTGDCEDLALEKRKRLVARGLPRAAIRISVVFHKEFKCPHAVLLAETSKGTIVLDNLTNELLCWDKAPYNYASRERPDGLWEHFDQSFWEWQPIRSR